MTSFDLVITLITIAAVLAVVLGVVNYLVLAERKVSAYMQDRVGPNRVGPAGIFQPIADGLKMLFKEDITPSHVDKVFYVLAPALATATALIAFAVVPFGPTVPPPSPVPLTGAGAPADLQQAEQAFYAQQQAYQDAHSFVIAPGLDVGILFVFAVSALAVYGIILGGWSANNKYTLLGGLRSTAQIISYEIPLGLSILGVLLVVGSLNLERIIDWQAGHGWFILYQPLAFVLFLTSVFAECNRLPFDLPEAEQELVGGYHTEYSGLKFGLFMLGEYSHMISTSFLLAICFFGGWHFPGLAAVGGIGGVILKFLVLLAKVGFFILLYMFVRWTLPRFRFDQLMALAWKVMIPLALLNLLLVMAVLEFGGSLWILPAGSVALFFGAALASTGRPGSHRRPVGRSTPPPAKVGVGP